jgi:hypothetical protein
MPRSSKIVIAICFTLALIPTIMGFIVYRSQP